MGNKKPFFLFLFLCLAPFHASSSELPSVFCEPAEQVKKRAKTCAENAQFLRAAQACLARLKEWEKGASQQAQASFAADSDNTQLGQFQSSERGYQTSTKALAGLIAIATLAKRELGQYPDEVTLPSEVLNPRVAGPNPMDWAMKNGCYATAQNELKSLRRKVDQKLLGYQEAQIAATKNMGKSKGDSGAVSSLTKGATGGNVREARPLPKGNSQFKDSQVTGVAEKKLPAK